MMKSHLREVELHVVAGNGQYQTQLLVVVEYLVKLENLKLHWQVYLTFFFNFLDYF